MCWCKITVDGLCLFERVLSLPYSFFCSCVFTQESCDVLHTRRSRTFRELQNRLVKDQFIHFFIYCSPASPVSFKESLQFENISLHSFIHSKLKTLTQTFIVELSGRGCDLIWSVQLLTWSRTSCRLQPVSFLLMLMSLSP